MARRRRNGSLVFAGALAVSLIAHPLAGLVYELTRPVPKPKLLVEISGDGGGTVVSVPGGVRCDKDECRATFEPGTAIKLVATRGEGSTFEGWEGPCGSQSHRLFRWVQDRLLESATYDEVDENKELYDFLARHSEPPENKWPLECEVKLDRTTKVTAHFGVQPEEVEVSWVQLDDKQDQPPKEAPKDDSMTITLPDPDKEAQNVIEPEKKEPPPDEMPMEEPKPPEMVAKEPPPPQIPKPQPPPPKPKLQQKKKLETYRMKSVEVPDENEVDKAPDDATFLSDKNRDVAEQTQAKQTNLERAAKGDKVYSEKSDVDSEEIGAKEDETAQLEDTEPSDLDVEREEETAHSGKEKIATGVIVGEEGERGQEGEGGDGRKAKNKGVLAMRGIEGRGAPGGPVKVRREVEEEGRGAPGKPGEGGKRGKPGKRGRRGIKTQLSYEDYKRIVGKDVAQDEQKVAKRKMSKRRGRFQRKQAAIRSSLENFVPEVKPGNQTALKTRAAPFALYIARMHRRIHELWGFGFLEDLDDKSSTNPMNDWSLWTNIEIVINPDGTIDKTTIVKPSGVLTFDVAALDVLYTAGPFEAPPDKIKSADGKVYLHWRFHRDWRQCGTFGVDPFILSNPPKGHRDRGLDDGDLVKRVPRRRRGRAGRAAGDSHDAAAATARATANMPTPDDPRAQQASNLWLTGFTQGDVSKMIRVSGVPFRSGDQVVANQKSELGAVYRNVLSESGGRRPTQARLLSAAGYRQHFGALPPGVDATASHLFFVVRLKGERFTLVLQPNATGNYEVVGFHR